MTTRNRIAQEFNGVAWDETYFDTRDFRAYMSAIEAIIFAADGPLCVREIHSILGASAKPRWTMDALEQIQTIEACAVLPTRYRPQSRQIGGLTRSVVENPWYRIFQKTTEENTQ
ncbi:MAG: hypothetical protein ABI539_08325 [Acidobacteriota bacterium]